MGLDCGIFMIMVGSALLVEPVGFKFTVYYSSAAYILMCVLFSVSVFWGGLQAAFYIALDAEFDYSIVSGVFVQYDITLLSLWESKRLLKQHLFFFSMTCLP